MLLIRMLMTTKITPLLLKRKRASLQYAYRKTVVTYFATHQWSSRELNVGTLLKEFAQRSTGVMNRKIMFLGQVSEA